MYMYVCIYINISLYHVYVPIFPYHAVAEGGARPSTYFRQGNRKSETTCFKISDENFAPKAKFMKQIAPQAKKID